MNNRRNNNILVRGLWLGIALILTAGVVAIASMGQTRAQEQVGQAFSISPPLIEMSADPGEAVVVKIKLTNISSGELLIKTQLNDFGAKNETGEPNIIFDDTDNSDYSLRQWMTSPEPFMLASRETKTLEIPVAIPVDAEPGGHYAVVRFTGTAPELEQSGVALSASIGSLVLMQVSGDIVRQANVEEFFTGRSNGERSTFFEQGPISFVERIRNSGNVHVKPTGTVEVTNMFGNVVATLPVNGVQGDADNPPRSILPNSIRRFDQTLQDEWLFGRYEAKLSLSYGDDSTLESTVVFWVIPYKLILALLIGVLVVGWLCWFGIRKYNAHIIRKAQATPLSGRKK